ncbi:MAG: hypothetical protein ACLPX8_19860 [Bryobacteraceae bacterium]|jgi:hypothetical protein
MPDLEPHYEPVRASRPRPSAILHLHLARDGTVRITALFEPPLDPDPAHVPGDVEAIAQAMIRAAEEKGAKQYD